MSGTVPGDGDHPALKEPMVWWGTDDGGSGKRAGVEQGDGLGGTKTVT